MANLMLECVPPTELANRGQVIEITNKISNFSRLCEIIVEDLGEVSAAKIPSKWRQAPVDIKLRFGWNDAHPGIPALEGQVSTRVALVCQRCLNPFELELDVGLNLLLPPTGAAPDEHEGLEVWEFDENDVRPADIVEEALIMALPLSALHESSDNCAAISVDDPSDESRKTRPFEDLQSLMTQANEIDD